MIVNQYKQTVLISKRYKVQPQIRFVSFADRSGVNTTNIIVEGPTSEKSNIFGIAKDLEAFIKKELEDTGPPSETIQHRCKDSEKAEFKIAQFLTNL